MFDEPLRFHISCIFVIIEAIYLVFVLFRKFGYFSSGINLKPARFIGFSVFVFGLTGLVTALLGVLRADFAFGLALGVLISICHPLCALCFFISLFILRPWEAMPPNSFVAVVPRALALVSLLSWLIYTIKNKRFSIKWNRGCSLYASLIGWLVLSACFSSNALSGIQGLFEMFFPITILCLLVVNTVSDRLDIQSISTSLAISITGMIIASLIPAILNPEFGVAGFRMGVEGLFGNSNDLASLIVLVLPFMLAGVIFRKISTRTRIMLCIPIAVLLFALWLTQSRGGVLAFLISGIIYFIANFKRGFKSWLIVIVFVIVAGGISLALNRNEDDLSESQSARLGHVNTALRMLKVNPLFGVGYGNYTKLYEQFTTNFIEAGERTAHSTWLLVMAEGGLPALFILVYLFVTTFKAAWSIRKIAPEFLLSLISYTVTMTFLSHTYIFIPYLLYAVILVASRVYKADAVR